jgi:hypothetical protein
MRIGKAALLRKRFREGVPYRVGLALPRIAAKLARAAVNR